MSPLIEKIIGVVLTAIFSGVAAYILLSNQVARLENETEHNSSDIGLLRLEVKELRKEMAIHSPSSSPDVPDGASFKGAIVYPEPNTTVGQTFNIEGTVSQDIPPYHHLWLIVRRGEKMWPKDPELFVVDGKWKKQIADSGTGRFSVILFLIDQTEHDRIMEWVKHGTEAGDFPGFSSFTGKPITQVALEKG